MTDIEKLAALAIRLFGGLWAGRVLLGLLFPPIVAAFGGPSHSYSAGIIVANLVYLAIALGIAALSKPLGKLFGRGLGQEAA